MLKDIHPAPAPGWWPPAPGWWLLLLLCGLLLWWLGRILLRRWRAYRWQRQLARRLEEIRDRYHDQQRAYLAALNQLLKRVLMASGNTTAASLSMDEWANYLRADGEDLSEAESAAIEVLTSGHYQPRVTVDVDLLHAWARRWLRRQGRG